MNYENPFANTKASHLTDDEVMRQWVDLDSQHRNLLGKLKSATPAILIGGKGCGKTHLMRYYSFPLQRLRFGASLIEGLQKEGFVGVYGRIENFNPHRFEGKNQNTETWSGVFQFAFQLWLAEIMLRSLVEIRDLSPEIASSEKTISEKICFLFEGIACGKPDSFEDVFGLVSSKRREVDHIVNNCGITGKLSVRLTLSPGTLLLGIPSIVRSCCKSFELVRFHYLLDEFELLLPYQQTYINTFLREVGESTSIKIGSRLYGLKTFATLNDGEVNKEGSEYEKIELEARSNGRSRDFSRFARNLIVKRLSLAGQVFSTDTKTAAKTLDGYFEEPESGLFARERTKFVNSRADATRTYFVRLRKQLASVAVCAEDIDHICENLSCTEFPLLEKAGILLFYKNWNPLSGQLVLSREIASYRDVLISDGSAVNPLARILEHFKLDLVAQLCREYKVRQDYAGLETLIGLSAGLPRSLLMIMRHTFELAEFRGEFSPQSSGWKISKSIQRDAVGKAANWFFEDALIKGREGVIVQRAIRNLGELFRSVRFSDKPVESSLSTFAVDLMSLSEKARKSVLLAEEYSLLVRAKREHRDRNSSRVLPKFQLSPMLAPIWDLPLSRRGVIQLTTEECEIIFVGDDSTAVRRIIDARVRRMTAPHFGSDKSVENKLPDLFDE